MTLDEMIKRLEEANLVASASLFRHEDRIKEHEEWLRDNHRMMREHQDRLKEHKEWLREHEERIENEERRHEAWRLEQEEWQRRHEIKMAEFDDKLNGVIGALDQMLRDRRKRPEDDGQ
jgi:hypothetical protein